MFEDEGNRLAQIRQAFLTGFPLAVCARDFGAIGNVPVAVLLHDCREFTAHTLLFYLWTVVRQIAKEHEKTK